LTNLDKFVVARRYQALHEMLFRLWVMLVGVTQHLVWTQRNHRKHRSKFMPPTHVLVDVTFSTWMSTIRHWLRLHSSKEDDLASMHAALMVLLGQPIYSELYVKHPRCLELDTAFDVH